MARVTVEDCVLKVPNRFELVLMAAQRAKNISAGAALTVDRDRDKNPVVALREIAEDKVDLDDLRNTLVTGMQKNYKEEDIAWVENAVCMRSAGVPVEMLIEYVKLYQQGDETLEARKNLLMEAKNEVQKQLDKYQATMDRLNFKISRYEEAVKTGILSWETEEEG